MFNLLTEPIIRIRGADGSLEGKSLPGVLAGLSASTIQDFPAQQPHQGFSWRAFLVQLAAGALHRAGLTEPPIEEERWRELLRALTPEFEGDEPWSLVVEDLSKPAFMQPPVAEGKLDGFKNVIRQADNLDMLATAKNHDVKARRAGGAEVESWLFSILSLQTMDGFFGAGNYGVSRMNGGFASRPGIRLIPGLDPGAGFRRDLSILLEERPAQLREYGALYVDDGELLLWLRSWDGKISRPMKGLDPGFIEICRRVRLVLATDGLTARTTPTKAARLESKAFKGVIGDPWTPIRLDKKETVALNVTERGFHYDLLRRLLFADGYQGCPTMRLRPRDPQGDWFLECRCLARGQGGTNGYHERRIPIPPRVQPMVLGGGDDAGRDQLAETAREMVERAGTVMRKALGSALQTLLHGDPPQSKEGSEPRWDERAGSWMDRFDQAVDEAYFHKLWESLEQEDPDNHAWLAFLRDQARRILISALDAVPHAASRRHRVMANAQRRLEGALKTHLPELYPPAGQQSSAPQPVVEPQDLQQPQEGAS